MLALCMYWNVYLNETECSCFVVVCVVGAEAIQKAIRQNQKDPLAKQDDHDSDGEGSKGLADTSVILFRVSDDDEHADSDEDDGSDTGKLGKRKPVSTENLGSRRSAKKLSKQEAKFGSSPAGNYKREEGKRVIGNGRCNKCNIYEKEYVKQHEHTVI